MSDFFYRTEDIRPSDIHEFYVDSKQDRNIVDALKNRNPSILVGSRGVGKSFLLRVAEWELWEEFEAQRVVPVYISFVKSSLLQSNDPEQFKHWMLARICSVMLRTLKKHGLFGGAQASARFLAGSSEATDASKTAIEKIAEQYEMSWKEPGVHICAHEIPDVESFKEAVEDLSEELNVKRFVLLFDEAAHIFVPEQQRQFFTLFRDLRSYCITCNAAVYPGVTSFGDTFQVSHDATMLYVERNVLEDEYVDKMREIIEKQADSSILKNIAKNGQNFAVLAYAATGNPRLLIKTVGMAPLMNSSQINSVIREFYRSDVWSDHSLLAEKYLGHRGVVDWGRKFIENYVLPELKSKNDSYLLDGKGTSTYIWIHRDAPEIAKEALRVLCYTGIISEHSVGIKATRSEIGTRYIVNLGCLFSQETTPAQTSFSIAKGLTPRRMTEFGAGRAVFSELIEVSKGIPSQSNGLALSEQLNKPIDVLDISAWLKCKLRELSLVTVGDVLEASEEQLKKAWMVGNVRARRMRNAAEASVLEYLSG